MPELDPRIITSIGENYARLPSINEGIAQRQGIQMRDMAIGQQQQAQAIAEQERARAAQNRVRMGELLPGASRGDQASIDQLYQVDPAFAEKLDTRQREKIKAGIEDLASAVIYSRGDDAKWEQMINFYAKDHPEFAKYRGHREYADQALMALGQMDKLLKASEQKVITPQAGAGAFSITPGLPGSGVETLVAPNDGTQTVGAPVNGGGAPTKVTDAASYNAVPPGGMYQTPDGHIRQKPGGPTQPASGSFPG